MNDNMMRINKIWDIININIFDLLISNSDVMYKRRIR